MHILNAHALKTVLDNAEADVCASVRDTYLSYGAGEVVNPPSAFLRFPHRPNARIIALPAHLDREDGMSGIKWIASYPDNVAAGRPRASAVMVLNSATTGEPFAFLEASQISAARTAASAAVGADAMQAGGRQARCLGVVGTGPIAERTVDYLVKLGWEMGAVRVCDLDAERARAFARDLADRGWRIEAVDTDAADTLAACDLVVFGTSATHPHLDDPALLAHRPLVLHLSLRDLSPAMIAAADNVTDDVDHVLSAQTSLHLAEQKLGHRDFVNGPLDGLLRGEVALSRDRPRIFSPFGLGVLDLAVARWVYRRAVEQNRAIEITDFLPVNAAMRPRADPLKLATTGV